METQLLYNVDFFLSVETFLKGEAMIGDSPPFVCRFWLRFNMFSSPFPRASEIVFEKKVSNQIMNDIKV